MLRELMIFGDNEYFLIKVVFVDNCVEIPGYLSTISVLYGLHHNYYRSSA